MGRDAHITRLALGRSPFDEPLRDEDGNFILGPHAHSNDNVGYRQQFDERGHPRNSASKAAARRLRYAQNDVLAAVGVVVRRDEANKSNWEKLDRFDKCKLIILENQSGRELKAIDRVSGLYGAWAITSLRRRILTFGPYFRTPLAVLSWMEWNAVGPWQFLAPGLPCALLTAIPQLYRYYIREPDVEEIVNYPNPDYAVCMTRGTQVAMVGISTLLFLIELPLQTFSTLQRLHVVGPTKWLPPSSFIPFTKMSPLWLPSLPKRFDALSVTTYLLACARTPFCLTIVRDYLNMQIGFRLYALLRQVLSRTDRSDRYSASVADEIDVIDETSIPCIGFTPGGDGTRRNYGPRSFLGAFRQAFPYPYAMMNFLSGGRLGRSRGRLDRDMEHQLKLHARASYRSRQRRADNWPATGSPDELKLRREIVESTFEDVNLYPSEELVDAEDWTDAVFSDMDDLDSTDTPKTEELFDLDEIILETYSSGQTDTQGADHDRPGESSNAVLPLDTALSDPGIIDSRWSSVWPTHTDGSAHEPFANPNSSGTVVNGMADSSGDGHAVSGIEGIGQHSVTAVNLADGSDTAAALLIDIERLQTDSQYLDDIFEEQMRRLEHEDAQEHAEPTFAQVVHTTDDLATILDENAHAAEANSVDAPTPDQGISRATSLIDAQRRRPLRRLTDTGPAPDGSLVAFTDPLRSRSTRHRTRMNGYRRPLSPVHRREHRMTFLSTFAVDSLAWHASAIITNFILLPLEAVYLRSLVNWVMTASSTDVGVAWYLEGSPLLTIMNTELGGRMRVFRLGEWFGGSGGGSRIATGTQPTGSRMEYVGALMLTLGLEALVRGTFWYIGTRVAIKRGAEFGWGKF